MMESTKRRNAETSERVRAIDAAVLRQRSPRMPAFGAVGYVLTEATQPVSTFLADVEADLLQRGEGAASVHSRVRHGEHKPEQRVRREKHDDRPAKALCTERRCRPEGEPESTQRKHCASGKHYEH